MKKIIAIFSLIAICLLGRVQNANAQHGGFGGGGGGGVIAYPMIGGLIPFYYRIDIAKYGTGTARVDLCDNNGPSDGNGFVEFNMDPTQTLSVNLGTFHKDLNDIFASGPYNDRARSAIFTGQVAGKTFKFFDDPSGSTNDDWTEVTFSQNIPANYSYFLWTFEKDAVDPYVTVTYHHYNGLDGKVSNVQMQ
ncbi:hypothetical protein HDF18_23045 [Mucilaginibacter sp. X5P1]|uniref:hypothetical protein n=1 Tax=Mucilaginibacter sp. X5P1 TaxID=2723088 RepID=UPI001609FD20|nr:hypothetical protein [Mucilaginibacter sp. X5P1]MBB6141163.1 hypothetical protein [Mucilaginibacter sp. X5P1]